MTERSGQGRARESAVSSRISAPNPLKSLAGKPIRIGGRRGIYPGVGAGVAPPPPTAMPSGSAARVQAASRRTAASSDSPPPNSNRSSRTQRVNDRGGVLPSVRAKTSSSRGAARAPAQRLDVGELHVAPAPHLLQERALFGGVVDVGRRSDRLPVGGAQGPRGRSRPRGATRRCPSCWRPIRRSPCRSPGPSRAA